MYQHVADSIEAAIIQLQKKPIRNAYETGKLDGLMWALDLLDFSRLDTHDGS